jgi:hypothetical protein
MCAGMYVSTIRKASRQVKNKSNFKNVYKKFFQYFYLGSEETGKMQTSQNFHGLFLFQH